MGTRWNRLVEAVLTSIHNLCLSRNMKIWDFLSENFHFRGLNFQYIWIGFFSQCACVSVISYMAFILSLFVPHFSHIFARRRFRSACACANPRWAYFAKRRMQNFLMRTKEESNQIARMRRLICVSIGRIYQTIFFFTQLGPIVFLLTDKIKACNNQKIFEFYRIIRKAIP